MKRAEDKLLNFKTTKDLAWGMATYTSGSIFGPLLFFGGFGYFLDRYFSTKPVFILVGVLIAFIFTNILIFKKLIRLSRALEEPIRQAPLAGSTPKDGQVQEEKIEDKR